MKKEISILAVVIILFLQGMPVVVADDEVPSENQDGNMVGEQRGLEHAGEPKRDALSLKTYTSVVRKQLGPEHLQWIKFPNNNCAAY